MDERIPQEGGRGRERGSRLGSGRGVARHAPGVPNESGAVAPDGGSGVDGDERGEEEEEQPAHAWPPGLECPAWWSQMQASADVIMLMSARQGRVIEASDGAVWQAGMAGQPRGLAGMSVVELSSGRVTLANWEAAMASIGETLGEEEDEEEEPFVIVR